MAKEYFESVFPANEVYRGIVRSPNTEVAFVVCEKSTGSEQYWRPRSYVNAEHLRDDIVRVASKGGLRRVEVGATYSMPPTKQHRLTPQECPLRIDIDADGSGRTCPCGKEKRVCDQCWPIMQQNMLVISKWLKEDYKLEKFFWVFSGRRGVHCWIFDDNILSKDNVWRDKFAQDITNFNIILKESHARIKDVLPTYAYKMGLDEVVLKPMDFALKKTIWDMGRPIIDTQVTTSAAHLLGLPFTLHNTGWIRTVIDPATFNPLTDAIHVDHVHTRMEEFNASVALMRKVLSI